MNLDTDDEHDPDDRTSMKVRVHPHVQAKLHSLRALGGINTISAYVNALLVHALDLDEDLAHEPTLDTVLNHLTQEDDDGG